jgi:very-short-patch-repair endonuclease
MLKSIKEIISPNDHTDSPIEELVYKELLKYGLEPKIQFQVGVFYIDLAFPEIKLAIEADGKDYHSNKEQKERDKYRQEKLEKMGWKFERFTGSFIYKFADFVAGKIALRYFKDKLTTEQKQLAFGRVINYFTKQDLDFAFELLTTFQDGYIYRKTDEKAFKAF